MGCSDCLDSADLGTSTITVAEPSISRLPTVSLMSGRAFWASSQP